jgi:hypothetical protein
MAFFIVKAFNKNVEKILGDWYNGRYRKELQKYFIRKLERGIYLVSANGEILAFLWALKTRYGTDLDIFGATPLHEWNVPEIVKKAAQYLNEEKRKRKFNKKEEVSREELRKIWVDCFVTSRRES